MAITEDVMVVNFGLKVREDGQVVRETRPATTIAEAQRRADDLRAKLTRRDVHADVLHFCRAELLKQNYFHAVRSVRVLFLSSGNVRISARCW